VETWVPHITHMSVSKGSKSNFVGRLSFLDQTGALDICFSRCFEAL